MLLSPLVLFKSLSAAQAFQQWSRHLLRGAAHRSYSQPHQLAASHTHSIRHMTTSQKPRSKAQAAQQHLSPANEQPSTSSNGSELFALLDRHPLRACSPGATASTKSAKRKAAEALLAAQYGGTSMLHSSNPAAAAPPPPAAAAAATPGARRFCSSDVAAPRQAAAPSNKRQKNMLTAAITRLGGEPAQVSPAAAGLAAAAGDAPQPQQKPAQLQRMLQQHLEAAGSSWQQQKHPAGGLQDAEGHLHVQSDDSTAGADQRAGGVLSVEAAGAAKQQRPQHTHEPQAPVMVPACGTDCVHKLAQGWCHSQVKLPHVDWGRVMEADLQHAPSFKLATGYERLQMPGGIQVLIVEQAAHIPSALAQLRASMQDPVVAIDLEWRPEHGRGFTPVAMVQLSSSKLAVLIRTCRMGYRLPQPLKDFLSDGQVHLLGFSWAGADEGKMRSTFGVGAKDFGRFLDLQLVAQGLGYHGFGLARLTRQVLGITMPKNKRISMSNWESSVLSRAQVKYAALDVLMAGQVFRALRLWHSSPSLCEVCHYNLGAAEAQQVFSCQECDKAFWDIKGYVHHCQRAGHKAEWAECEGCGCARALPWPSMQDQDGTAAGGGQAAAQQQQPSSQHSS